MLQPPENCEEISRQREVLVKINNTTHFRNGDYREEGTIAFEGANYEYLDICSAQFNQLKAKLFNLIEGTSVNEKQQNALKGLVKGFCNTAYNNTVGDLQGLMKRMGFESSDYIPTAEPLEEWARRG